MLAAFAAFSCGDLIAKLLTADYHPVQIAFSRQLGVVAAVAVLFAMKGSAILRSTVPKLQVARGLCAVVSATSFIFAISYVPLADAVAVTFAAPFMVTVLGAVVLREAVGTKRWIAVTAGFIGTLVIVRPGFGVFHPAIFLVLLAAAAFALRQIVSRYIGRRDRTMTTLAYTALTSVIVLAIPMPLIWITPVSIVDVAMMAGVAIMAGMGEFLLIRALEIAAVVVVAPMQYSLILYGTLWGYLVFAELPDRWTWLGTSIIVGSGLYMLYLERRRTLLLLSQHALTQRSPE
ncbi:MAG: DMT family transporter [Gammaproteobacteria bacterium]|nr:DMT family transporter [Gammaproteobacteria bacterium]